MNRNNWHKRTEIGGTNQTVISKNRTFQFNILSDLITFVRWISGFSIGGLSLIFVNIDTIRNNFPNNEIFPILFLLMISVFFGIFFHIAVYFYQIRLNSAYVFLSTSFSEKDEINPDPESIDKEDDIDIVLYSLKVDFGEDLSEEKIKYDKLPNEECKKEILKNLKKHHEKLSDWAREDYKNAIDYVMETYKLAFGLKSKHIKKIIEESKQEKITVCMKIWKWLTNVSFFICNISFFSALILFSVLFFK